MPRRIKFKREMREDVFSDEERELSVDVEEIREEEPEEGYLEHYYSHPGILAFSTFCCALPSVADANSMLDDDGNITPFTAAMFALALCSYTQYLYDTLLDLKTIFIKRELPQAWRQVPTRKLAALTALSLLVDGLLMWAYGLYGYHQFDDANDGFKYLVAINYAFVSVFCQGMENFRAGIEVVSPARLAFYNNYTKWLCSGFGFAVGAFNTITIYEQFSDVPNGSKIFTFLACPVSALSTAIAMNARWYRDDSDAGIAQLSENGWRTQKKYLFFFLLNVALGITTTINQAQDFKDETSSLFDNAGIDSSNPNAETATSALSIGQCIDNVVQNIVCLNILFILAPRVLEYIYSKAAACYCPSSSPRLFQPQIEYGTVSRGHTQEVESVERTPSRCALM